MRRGGPEPQPSSAVKLADITQDAVELLLLVCLLLNWRWRRRAASISGVAGDAAVLPDNYVESLTASAVDAVWEGLAVGDVDFADQRTLEHFVVSLCVPRVARVGRTPRGVAAAALTRTCLRCTCGCGWQVPAVSCAPHAGAVHGLGQQQVRLAGVRGISVGVRTTLATTPAAAGL